MTLTRACTAVGRFEARGEGEAGSPRAALDLETLFFLSPPSVRRIRENSQWAQIAPMIAACRRHYWHQSVRPSKDKWEGWHWNLHLWSRWWRFHFLSFHYFKLLCGLWFTEQGFKYVYRAVLTGSSKLVWKFSICISWSFSASIAQLGLRLNSKTLVVFSGVVATTCAGRVHRILMPHPLCLIPCLPEIGPSINDIRGEGAL